MTQSLPSPPAQPSSHFLTCFCLPLPILAHFCIPFRRLEINKELVNDGGGGSEGGKSWQLGKTASWPDPPRGWDQLFLSNALVPWPRQMPSISERGGGGAAERSLEDATLTEAWRKSMVPSPSLALTTKWAGCRHSTVKMILPLMSHLIPGMASAQAFFFKAPFVTARKREKGKNSVEERKITCKTSSQPKKLRTGHFFTVGGCN